MSGPLSGIKVIELAAFVAAPTVGRLMADMGADVIKVESPAGDGWRQTGVSYLPKRFNEDENPIFDIYNNGKKFVCLDLKDPEGLEALHKLLADADVFLTNTRPRSLKKLGLDYETLSEKYPQLIYAHVLGYGEKGPEKDTPAFDTTAFWSRGGFLRDLAPDGPDYYPVNAPSGVGDSVTGFLLLAEINSALFNRTRTGKGDFVSSTLFHNAVFCFGTMAIQTQRPWGREFPKSRKDFGIPGGHYKCADGEWVFFTPAAPGSLEKFCHLLGLGYLLDDPDFVPGKRYDNRDRFYPLFRDAMMKETSAYWRARADELDITITRLHHFADISEDPQAWENGFLEHVKFRNGEVDVMPSSPIEMNSATPGKTFPAPLPGRDTAEVLADLGYTQAEIDAMFAKGTAINKN